MRMPHERLTTLQVKEVKDMSEIKFALEGQDRLVRSLCRATNAIYNSANYIIREEFSKSAQIPDTDVIEKKLEDQEYFNAVPRRTAHIILDVLRKRWIRYREHLEEWRSGRAPPGSFRPKPPKMRNPRGLYFLPFHPDDIEHSGEFLKLPLLGELLLPSPIYREISQVAVVPYRSGKI